MGVSKLGIVVSLSIGARRCAASLGGPKATSPQINHALTQNRVIMEFFTFPWKDRVAIPVIDGSFDSYCHNQARRAFVSGPYRRKSFGRSRANLPGLPAKRACGNRQR